MVQDGLGLRVMISKSMGLFTGQGSGADAERASGGGEGPAELPQKRSKDPAQNLHPQTRQVHPKSLKSRILDARSAEVAVSKNSASNFSVAPPRPRDPKLHPRPASDFFTTRNATKKLDKTLDAFLDP